MEDAKQRPELPTWADPPADPVAATLELKNALRNRITSSGRSVDDVFRVIDDLVATRVQEIKSANDEFGSAWPTVEFDRIAEHGVLPDDVRQLVRRRGCLIVRGHFERAEALEWDRSLVDYLDENRFDDAYRGAGDDFFSTVKSKPQFYPIYWSPAQMQARQSDRMAMVQTALNSVWVADSDGTTWFDPDRNVMYPDRARRRPEGTSSPGLGLHIDAGTLDLWMAPEYQRAFRHVFDGSIERFDPWQAAHRTDGSQYPGSTMTSVFRTFQGWTALSDMQADQGVLQSIPIPEAIAYLLLRPLLDDVPDHDMCGVRIGRTFPITETWHQPLIDGLSRIPDVQAGDSAWWHGDLVHGVAPVTDQQGWGNVMYIPAAPWCGRNERYSAKVLAALQTGQSPSDFPEEHYEQEWPNRFTIEDLNDNGRRSVGLS